MSLCVQTRNLTNSWVKMEEELHRDNTPLVGCGWTLLRTAHKLWFDQIHHATWHQTYINTCIQCFPPQYLLFCPLPQMLKGRDRIEVVRLMYTRHVALAMAGCDDLAHETLEGGGGGSVRINGSESNKLTCSENLIEITSSWHICSWVFFSLAFTMGSHAWLGA